MRKSVLLLVALLVTFMVPVTSFADGRRSSHNRDRHSSRYEHRGSRDHRGGMSRDERNLAWGVIGVQVLSTVLDAQRPVVVYTEPSGHYETRIVGYRTEYRTVRHSARYETRYDRCGNRIRVMVEPAWTERIPYQVPIKERVWVPDYYR